MELHRRARELAAELLEVAPDDLEVLGDRVQVRGSPRFGLTLGELAAQAVERGAPAGLSADGTYHVERLTTFAGGVHLAVVAVDPETGVVRVERYICAHDCGRVLNPLIVEGQVQGGLAHGLGNVLLEASVYDAQGQLLAGSLMDYALPRATDVPEVEGAHLETPSPYNPEGIKGAGEGGTIGAFPAIANAVEDAVWPRGGRITELPITAERVLRNLQSS
jgi:carbon-monoxide dehydrogenase large subunit